MGSREEEIRTDLKKCDEFLAMTEDSFREDVEESQKLYYEACEDIERINQEYQQELQRAEKEHFISDQMKNLHAVYRDEIKDAEEYATEQGKILKREQQRLEQYPALVEQAKKDKAKLEKELSAKNAMEANHSPALLFEPNNETDDYTMVTAYINEEFARIHEEEKTDMVVDVKETNKTTASAGQKLADDSHKIAGKGQNLADADEEEDNFYYYQEKLKVSGVNEKRINMIEKIFDIKRSNDFRRADIANILKCSIAKATYIMSDMKKAGIIEKVIGKGNGWYRFIDHL